MKWKRAVCTNKGVDNLTEADVVMDKLQLDWQETSAESFFFFPFCLADLVWL